MIEIVVTNIADDGTEYRYLPVLMKDWDEAITRAISYAQMEKVPTRIKSIERVDLPTPICECGEKTMGMRCTNCNKPLCYDCAKNSRDNEPICKDCKAKEVV